MGFSTLRTPRKGVLMNKDPPKGVFLNPRPPERGLHQLKTPWKGSFWTKYPPKGVLMDRIPPERGIHELNTPRKGCSWTRYPPKRVPLDQGPPKRVLMKINRWGYFHMKETHPQRITESCSCLSSLISNLESEEIARMILYILRSIALALVLLTSFRWMRCTKLLHGWLPH
jgi:hypothetical protein